MISRRRHAVTTAGKAGTHRWILRFERRTPSAIEPLMGWTESDDTLSQVELVFNSRDEAVAYADRQGLAYRVEEEGTRATSCARKAPNTAEHRKGRDEAVGAVIWLNSIETAYGRCHLPEVPDLERALVSPAAVFASPDDVVRHPLLSLDCKREILWRWAWDEYLIEIAQAEDMPDGEPSRLDEVKAALLRLGETWRPHPAAPAAFAVRFDRDQSALAA